MQTCHVVHVVAVVPSASSGKVACVVTDVEQGCSGSWLNVSACRHCNESLLWGSQLNITCGPWLSIPRSKEFDCATCALGVGAQPNDKVMRTSRSLIRQGSQDCSCRTSLATKTWSIQHTPAGQLTTFRILLLLVDVD